jgi:hypothetical protein
VLLPILGAAIMAGFAVGVLAYLWIKNGQFRSYLPENNAYEDGPSPEEQLRKGRKMAIYLVNCYLLFLTLFMDAYL